MEPRQLVGQSKHHTAARTGNPAVDTATSSQASLLGNPIISYTDTQCRNLQSSHHLGLTLLSIDKKRTLPEDTRAETPLSCWRYRLECSTVTLLSNKFLPPNSFGSQKRFISAQFIQLMLLYLCLRSCYVYYALTKIPTIININPPLDRKW